MSGARHKATRVALGLGLFLLVLVEVQDLLHGLRSHARLRDRAVREAQQDGAVAQTRLAQRLRELPTPPAVELAHQGQALTRAAEADVYELVAGRMVAQTLAVPVQHWPTPDELAQVASGRPLVVGPVSGRATRLLTYLALKGPAGPLVLRLATPVPDVIEDLRERRSLMLARGLAVTLLVLGGGLALLGRGESQASPVALRAYEEAMARLRETGSVQSLAHRDELRRLEGLVQDREAMARAGELTAGIVHEVRNGLGTILGYARLLERSAHPDERGFGNGIREECEALETVVRRFNEFVSNETLRLGPVDLTRVVARVAARERRRAPAVALDMPAGDGAVVEGDEDLLERAVENVIRNALEAAAPEGTVSARVTVEEDGRHALLVVDDDGPGLAAEVRAGVRPFLTTKAGGMGLGLPIALKIARLHGGTLDLVGRTPRGARVRLRLPRVAGAGEAPHVPAPAEPA